MSSNKPSNTVRRTLVLCPAETPPSFDSIMRNTDESTHDDAAQRSNGTLVTTMQPPQRVISDSAQALSVLRRQGMILAASSGAGGNNSNTLSSPTSQQQPPPPQQQQPSGTDKDMMLVPSGGGGALTRRQPAARSLCYSLGRLSNHHYLSSVNATSNPYVSVTPQGPIIMRSGSGVLVMEDGEDEEDEADEASGHSVGGGSAAAIGASSYPPPAEEPSLEEDGAKRPSSPSAGPHGAEVEGRLGWRATLDDTPTKSSSNHHKAEEEERTENKERPMDDFSTQDRLLQCVPGSVLQQQQQQQQQPSPPLSQQQPLPPSRQPTVSRGGDMGLEERPTTAGFHAAFHAAPYDRVGNRRGLLELLKLRSDVAAMRGKQKNVAPIYRALKPRGSSMPGGGGSSLTSGMTASGLEKMMNQHAADVYGGSSGNGGGSGGNDNGSGAQGAIPPHDSTNAARPSSTGCMPHQTVPWESIFNGTTTGKDGHHPPASSGLSPSQPLHHHHDNTLLVSPSTSNVLPTHHQAVIREQADRRAAAAPPLLERSEGELQDELAKQSCDAVGLTPVLASAMPRGRYVVVNMLTTWGDNHEVGICGMEFYNERGDRILPVRVPSFAAMMGASTSSSNNPHVASGGGGSGGIAPSSKPAVGCDTQEVVIEKNLVSITGGAADGSFRVFVEYSATPEELSLWAADQRRPPTSSASSSSAPSGFPSGFGMATSTHSPSVTTGEHHHLAQKQLSAGSRHKHHNNNNNNNNNSGTLSGDNDNDTPQNNGNTHSNSALQRIQMDPRRQVFSVVDGVVNTHDESHMLAIPYTPGHHHLLCFVFAHPITLSMVRIYNYCGRGRVQTFKGARIVEITMDDDVIFRGEVQRHSGELLPDEESESGLQNCENILFTEDENVLCRIVASQHANGLAGGGIPDDDDDEADADADDADGGVDDDEIHEGGIARKKIRGAGRRRTGTEGAREEEEEDEPLFVRATTTTTSAKGVVGMVTPPPPSSSTRVVLRHNKYAYNDDMGTEPPMAWRGSRAGGGATGRLGADYGARASESPLLSNTAPAGALQPSVIMAGGGDESGGRISPQGDTNNECSLTAGSVMSGNTSSAPRQRRFTNPTRASTGVNSSSGTTSSQHGGGGGGAAPTPLLNHSTGEIHAAAATPQITNHQRPAKVAVYPSKCPKNIRSVCFLFLATWGDPRNIGLSGLRFRDATGNIIREPVFAWRVQYPDGSGAGYEEVAAFTEQVGFLFDEDPRTACTLPFQPAMQLIIVFENPVPSLGFLEVANYSVGERTFCGVKEVRLFLSTGDPMEAGIGPISISQREIDRYRCLWTYASEQKSRDALSTGGVFEVTPPIGVSLRKAPAYLSVPRFQTYDLSLQAGGGGGGAVDAWGEALEDAACPSAIGIGPGTGGSFDEDASGAGLGALGGMAGGGYFATSFASSLNASMNIRAAMAMKRARMVLRDRPDWLLDYQPYITPLLPVGYVCKVRLFICARDVGHAHTSGSSSMSDRPTATAGAGGEATALPFRSASDSLKAFMKEWVVHPFRSCAFVNENGELIRPINNDSAHQPSPSESVVDEPCCIPMVVESVISTVPPPANVPYQSQAPLQVMVDLVYVADIPFCMAVLCLNAPLVLDGSAAWVKQVQVFVDDSMVFNSTDAIISLERPTKAAGGGTSGGSGGLRNTDPPASFTNPKSTPSTLPPTSSGRSGGGNNAECCFPKCVSSMRPYILFTLDSNVLEEVQRKIREEGS